MGEVSASRHYQGAGLGQILSWQCPACGEVNAGPLEQGCASCGAGSPGRRVLGDPPPARTPQPPEPQAINQARIPVRGLDPVREAGVAFWQQNPKATMVDAFVAGYQAALAQTLRAAPPVAVDVAALAPEGRERRTLIAALKHFRDQILPEADEEVAGGEWCSLQEVDALIHRIEETL